VNAIPLTATLPGARTSVHSLYACVVPHFFEIAAAAPGTVTSIFVDRRQVVRRGQTLAIVEPAALHVVGERRGVALRAPAAGLVARRWASPGDVVGRGSAVLSIASAEDVLVVAKFRAGTSQLLGRGATALLHGAGREPLLATVTSVVEAPEWAEGDDAAPTRVVLSLPRAPAEALWPGTPVRVEIRP
jgi:multidrug resistance efflux pump